MSSERDSIRVLYSFPHTLGAGRIADTAWYQITGLSAAGVDMLVFPRAVRRPLPAEVQVRRTLAHGKLRVPYKVLG
ncbi:MAG: glycosyl transferase family 1, partial [Candidatus Dormibacteraeota bacterium]|nr:glycosyl transferase family 1 [Candidatus Dormibacteraeota bacterium]